MSNRSREFLELSFFFTDRAYRWGTYPLLRIGFAAFDPLQSSRETFYLRACPAGVPPLERREPGYLESHPGEPPYRSARTAKAASSFPTAIVARYSPYGIRSSLRASG